MKKAIILAALPIALFSCQKKSTFTYQEWTSEQLTAKNVLPKDLQTEKNAQATSYKEKKIEYSRQLINGKPVYNSFIKKITTDNKTELLQANIVEDDSLNTTKKITEVKKVNYQDLIKKQGYEFEKISLISNEDVILIEDNKPVDYTVVSYFNRYGVPYSTFFKADGTLARTERQGSQFTDVNATVYTDGPKLSQLTDQAIKNLAANPTLSNEVVFVTSEADKKINTLSPTLRFDTKDERFDQLQVFYYLNKSIQWMKDNLNVSIPRKIEAVVYVGFPDKTNSAFYFQNKIRLGHGDEVNYANIPHDASIVYHESFHALVDNVARLPYEGEGGSLNEAFADFFTCLLTERPLLGESSYLKGPYKRTLQLTMRLDEKNGGLYHDSQIFSSLLWEVKEKIGYDKAKQLAVETLIKLNAISKFADFNKKIITTGKEILSQEEQAVLQQILKSRGFMYE